MKSTIDLEIELLQSLYQFTVQIRRQKGRPDMAPVAAPWEIQFKRQLEELESRRAEAAQQPELLPPVGGVVSADEVMRRGKAALAAATTTEKAA